jgi:hypothetical protein
MTGAVVPYARSEVPPALVADALGYSHQVAFKHAAAAAEPGRLRRRPTPSVPDAQTCHALCALRVSSAYFMRLRTYSARRDHSQTAQVVSESASATVTTTSSSSRATATEVNATASRKPTASARTDSGPCGLFRNWCSAIRPAVCRSIMNPTIDRVTEPDGGTSNARNPAMLLAPNAPPNPSATLLARETLPAPGRGSRMSC